MATVLRLNINDLSNQLLYELGQKFGQSAQVEIRVQKKKKKQELFSDKQFWQIINMLDWTQKSHKDILAPAIKQLAEMPIVNIYLFADKLSEKLFLLDTRLHGDAYLAKQEDDYFSVDDYLYVRCAVVAEGQVYYEQVLNDPQTMPGDITFESLLSLADAAYKQQAGKPFDYQPSYNYETYSNKKGWQI